MTDPRHSEDPQASGEHDAAGDASSAGADPVGELHPEPAAGESAAAEPGPAAPRRWAGRGWAALAVVMLIELYVYGHRAEIEICVAKQGVHDFALLGQPRDDDNRWKFPRCESRMNLGLRSHFADRVADGAKVACRGATLIRNRGEAKACEAATDGWSHRVESRYVWPWDRRFYEHLFWFVM